MLVTLHNYSAGFEPRSSDTTIVSVCRWRSIPSTFHAGDTDGNRGTKSAVSLISVGTQPSCASPLKRVVLLNQQRIALRRYENHSVVAPGHLDAQSNLERRRCLFSDTWEDFPIAPSVLKRAEPDVNVVLLSEVVVDGGTVPAPAVIAGLQAKKPLGALLAP